MDDHQQRRLNEAAEQFTGALVESFRAVSARGERAQEQKGNPLLALGASGLSLKLTPGLSRQVS